MPEKRPRSRAANPARLTVASLGLEAKLVSCKGEAELKVLIERYEQLLCEWESLSYRTIKALGDRSHPKPKRSNALRHP
ncbi:hypothetical protein [Methylobacterium soli]|uniref:Uncharacterized protein n=1 Tax=Methylobacterium soli TaxID=553447 RepID=A0A6L3SPV9_9HYPH|nr:hypothetical protein [Methylobacterium soli]KAB1072383.1 hypothetical protein F6X53_28270 [Methylobacterium soli]GJE41414.1 hypothetical protein AEGHOMDF_0580 [Methylobacterium soli]